MPMIDVDATEGTFDDKHALAQDLAKAVMRWEQVPDLPLFTDNTAAFVHDLPAPPRVAGASAVTRIPTRTSLPPREPRSLSKAELCSGGEGKQPADAGTGYERKR